MMACFRGRTSVGMVGRLIRSPLEETEHSAGTIEDDVGCKLVVTGVPLAADARVTHLRCKPLRFCAGLARQSL